MLRFALALFPWLILQGCTAVALGGDRSVNDATGDDAAIEGLWVRVILGGLACAFIGALVGILAAIHIRVAAEGIEGIALVQRALLRTYRAVLPWVLVIAAITLFVLSSMAYAEGERAYWRAYYGGHMDSVPAEFDQRGPFEGSWTELTKLSYDLYLGYLVCFFVWLGARVWIARQILKGPDSGLMDERPSLI